MMVIENRLSFLMSFVLSICLILPTKFEGQLLLEHSFSVQLSPMRFLVCEEDVCEWVLVGLLAGLGDLCTA